ncbi:MAG: bifunctional diguanylate cyclase/phosphodiesterase, partial [Thermomicrobiales bacterium]
MAPAERPGSWDAIMRSIHADDRARIAHSIRAHVEQGADFDVEFRVVAPDGAARWMACKGEASARDEEGRSLHLHGVSFDITARKSVESEVAEAYELLEALMDHVPDALYIKDTESRFRRANRTTAVHLNVADRRDLLGKSDFDFFPEALARQFYEDEQTVLRSGVAIRNKLEPQSLDEESGTWFLTSIVPLRNAEGRSVGLLGSARDVSEERRQEIRLRQAEARFRALVEQIPAITYVKRVGEGVGRQDYVSPQITRILGYEPDEWIRLWDTRRELVLHPDDRDALDAAGSRANGTGEAVAVEYRHRHKDGRWIWIRDLAVRLPSHPGEPSLWQGVMLDLTEHKMMKDQLEHLALHDVLTGLPNRALFTQRLQHAVARTGRMHSYVALLFIDVDNFKGVNDSMGHEAGDELLTAVARRLSGLTRPGDTVARLGGDEFTIPLEDLTGHHHAMAVSERVLEAFRRPFHISGRMVFATPSIGVALSDGMEPRPLDVLRDADMAMYDAERAGKGRVRLFDPNDTGRPMPQGILEHELRRAFERGEIELFYQPIVDVATGSVRWLEALVRWRHPERGVLLPGAFVPFAEESGLILEIGAWAIREACRQAMAWRELDPDLAPV